MAGPVTDLGGPVAIPASWISGTEALAVGILSTSSGPAPPFPATWERIEVTLGEAGSGCGETDDVDLDGICAALDNCPATANPGQENQDGDSAGDLCDCAPADPLDGPPAEVDDSLVLVDDGALTTLGWDDEGVAGPFRLYRGTHDGAPPFAYDHACQGGPIAGTSTTDGELPPTGTMYYYLVSREGCGESVIGRDSLGQPIPNPVPCVP
jgi:hypothetical protein